MSNENKSFKETIKHYLDRRAEQDELFAQTYAKEGKTLEECCNYIIGEARKRGNAVAMTDEEVFGLAVHYYDEDDIKVYHGSMARKTEEEVKVTLSAEEMEEARKEARQRVIDRLAEEQYTLLKKKPSRGKKEAETEVQQMSLF